MRLYPPAWIVDRVSANDDEFNGYSFPGGTIIILFFYGMHRDRKYWTDPEVFRPERFVKGGEGEKSKSYLPFGAGPRLCIGNNFAIAEMAIFLHAFLNRFEVRPTKTEPKVVALVTLKPDKISLTVSTR